LEDDSGGYGEQNSIAIFGKPGEGRFELVMTGINAPADIMNKADYVTELVQVKHPYYKGARARKGIEY